MARLREGRANTARGAAHFLRETVARVRDAGASGQLTVRADSGFYNHAVVAVCRKQDVRFSITIRQQPNVRTLIEAIPEEDWTPIPYWLPGGADVAETTYTPFQHEGGCQRGAAHRAATSSRRPAHSSRSLRTIVTTPSSLDRAGELLELEADHRRHAEIENAIRDLQIRRRAEPSPLGPLRRERGVARGAGDRAQPRPLDGAARARRGNRDDQDAQAVATSLSPDGSPILPGAGPCTSRSAGPGLASGQPPWCGYGRYRSRPDARSQRRPELRGSSPACPRTPRAPSRQRPRAPPSRAERR